ncbi:MAG: hypothetical protein NZ772_19405, partial [Cyanobacteria bacterium]|nr:hypothetical protein [Cyanobacteriota bacterium]MDW8203360.1 hypothetical protein [Cyanobacteriota bacterium SKYGB_h_bin112]
MDYAQEYQQAVDAYSQGAYADALVILDRMVEAFPNDPSVRLLRGHTCCYGLQYYDIAQADYEAVLVLTTDVGLTDYAHQGLAVVQEALSSLAAIESAAIDSTPEDESTTTEDAIELDSPAALDPDALEAAAEEAAPLETIDETLDFTRDLASLLADRPEEPPKPVKPTPSQPRPSTQKPQVAPTQQSATQSSPGVIALGAPPPSEDLEP